MSRRVTQHLLALLETRDRHDIVVDPVTRRCPVRLDGGEADRAGLRAVAPFHGARHLCAWFRPVPGQTRCGSRAPRSSPPAASGWPAPWKATIRLRRCRSRWPFQACCGTGLRIRRCRARCSFPFSLGVRFGRVGHAVNFGVFLTMLAGSVGALGYHFVFAAADQSAACLFRPGLLLVSGGQPDGLGPGGRDAAGLRLHVDDVRDRDLLDGVLSEQLRFVRHRDHHDNARAAALWRTGDGVRDDGHDIHFFDVFNDGGGLGRRRRRRILDHDRARHHDRVSAAGDAGPEPCSDHRVGRFGRAGSGRGRRYRRVFGRKLRR